MKPELSNQITAYIDGTLSATDRSAFETLLATDTALAQTVAEHWLLAQAAREAAATQKRNEWLHLLDMDAPLSQNALPTLPKRRSAWQYVVGIAALLVMVFACYAVLHQANQPNTQALFAQNSQTPEVLGSAKMGANSDTQTATDVQLAHAFETFNSGDFAVARTIFAQLAPTDQTQTYIGICYFYEKNYVAAETTFKQNITSPATNWYLALIALQRNDAAACKNLLHNIPNNNANYYPKAQALLQQL